MRKLLLIGILAVVLLTPLLVQTVFSNPDVGLGYISAFVPATQDKNGMWNVSQGGTYTVTLKEVEFDHADISVHGSYTDGTKWEIVIGTDIAATGAMHPRGWYYTFTVNLPSGAGCTGTIHYRKGASDGSGNPNGMTHVAAEEAAGVWDPTVHYHKQKAGHFKFYYADGTPIPCQEMGVPEFPFATAVVTSLGLAGAFLVRRRTKKA